MSYRGGGSGGKFMSYSNIPDIIATVVSSKLATLHELQTVYGSEDLYNLYEIHLVNSINEAQKCQQ
jgi:hypothetical protein